LLSVIQKPKSNLEVDREQERCSQMQTVKDIPRLDTCTSPQFLHKLQTFQMNTAINATWKVTWCGFRNKEGDNVRSWVIICTPVGNCILCVKQRTGVLEPQDWDYTHAHTHRHGVALSKLDRFLWRSAFYSLTFHCHFDYHYCYNCTTTYTIYHYYSSLFWLLWSIIVLNATSLLWYSYEYWTIIVAVLFWIVRFLIKLIFSSSLVPAFLCLVSIMLSLIYRKRNKISW